ncbi:hypothetical protein P4529_15955 [Virgibacillus pantothenticus]|uniref:hypothetical protein n=1 Tax=Virgibacillus pantothenticus TaxID=1473 RepID=UPI0011155526|nr:hypothetical protein [Virgibacillus pantothenticus]MED3738290.1 hypothetical protein [Virgibacillus pantothenticus]QTY16860.1 hypothetical protein KBP50_02765 [Virgibacillus pantothenticus]
MKRASIVFTAGREGRKGESSLVMGNDVPPHKLYWGNKVTNTVKLRYSTLSQIGSIAVWKIGWNHG